MSFFNKAQVYLLTFSGKQIEHIFTQTRSLAKYRKQG